MAMRSFRRLLYVTAALVQGALLHPYQAAASQVQSSGADTGLSEALASFREAETPQEIQASILGVLETGASFEEVWSLIRADVPDLRGAESGELEWTTAVDPYEGTAFRSLILVPESYDPSIAYPVRVILHGGVGRGEWGAGGGWWPDTDGASREDAITVIPAAWNTHPWWRWSQLRHLDAVLRRLRREYNVDTNQHSLIGISDGGTGAYYVAAHLPTIWASVLPFIAHPAVLANPAVGPEGATYPLALVNHPYLVVSGDDDRLYPSRSVKPFIRDFQELGMQVIHHALPGVGHEMSWLEEFEGRIDDFVRGHRREPHPERIQWATDSPSEWGRAYWVVVESLGRSQRDRAIPTSKRMPPVGDHGRLTAVRSGNTIDLRTRGISQMTVLLSPDVIDFTAPVTISVNGRVIYNEEVRPSVETLLKWAGRDRDPRLLYGAEVRFRVR